jgi:hypothetical protein
MRSTWTTSELQEDFDVLGFGYGMCVVKRKNDGVRGALFFEPRYIDGIRTRIYFDFQEA